MNRQEEYEALRRVTDEPNLAAEHTLTRARVRNKRRMRVVRPLASLASAFAGFVLLVNISTPVAAACAKIPFLREIAKAVTFSQSLEDAVRHEYAQPINLVQTDGGVTAKVEYLIVDQKQVNVFFRLESEQYENLDITPTVLQVDGNFAPCCYGPNDYDVQNGTLQSITVDFIEEDVPAALRLVLEVRSAENWEKTQKASPGEDPLLSDPQGTPPEAVARFDFLLELDPAFTAAGETLAVGQTVTLDGQKITLTELEIYPTHLRINVEDDSENTAWLKRLDFYIMADGKKFDKILNGVTATGSAESPMMTSYRADSVYFYQADRLEIVVTGAEWLAKDMETVRVDLSSGSADRMPEGAELWSVEKKDGSYTITVRAMMRAPNSHHQIFNSIYYDTAGVEYDFNLWSSSSYAERGQTESKYFYVTFGIEDYPYTEVWLTPSYSSEWVAPTPITVKVK